VNTASRCGYTPQLKELQELHAKYGSKGLMVIGVPSNDFNQEDLSGGELAKFCKFNYGVEFTMLEKTSVKGANKHPLYQYLVQKSNSPNDEVSWNFEKFLVDKSGAVLGRYKSGTKPQDPQLISQIESTIGQKGQSK
jgi:glutathione peroxidase